MDTPCSPENPARIHVTKRFSPATIAVLLAFLSAEPVFATTPAPPPSCSVCSGEDHADVTFHASEGIAGSGTLSISLDQTTVSGAPNTSDGLTIIQPETIIDGTVFATGHQASQTAWNVMASFNATHGCDETVETCSKLSTDTNYGDWSSSSYPNWSFPGSQTSASIDFKIRVLRTDQGRATAPAAVTSVTPQTISYSDNVLQTSPAAFSTRVPLGATSETGRFNAGSLVMDGPLSTIVPSRAILKLHDPFGYLTSVTESQNGLDIQRQVKSSVRLADIQDVSGGFEIRIYEKGDYDEEIPLEESTYPVHDGAVPSVIYRYLPDDAEVQPSGIRMETIYRDQPAETTHYLSVSATEYQIVRETNLETVDVVSVLDEVDGKHMRHDIETVTRDGTVNQTGTLFSLTYREYQYQSVTPTVGETAVSPFLTYEQRQVDSAETPAVLETHISPATGFIGKPGTITRPDGSWEIRSYFAGNEQDSQPSWRGLPKQILRPWNGLPATPNDNNSSPQCTDITYTTVLVDGSYAVATRTTNSPTRSTIRQDDSVPSSLATLLTSAGLSSNWAPSSSALTRTTMADVSGTENIPSTTISYLSRPAYNQTSPPLTPILVPMLVPWSGRVFATLDAEGNGSVTGYEAGKIDSETGAYEPVTPAEIASATHIRTITLALRNGGLPANGEATQRIVIEDLSGRPLREELRIGTGSNSSLATAFTTDYNDAPANAISKVTRYHDGRVIEETTESSPFSSVQIDEQGITTTTTRDAIGRTTSVTVEGVATNGDFGEQPSRITSFSYSGRTTTTTTGGLTHDRTEDLTGRVISETDETGAITLTSYPNGGRDTQTTLPGNNPRLATNTIDGLPLSVTGTAVVNEAWSYSIVDGNLVTAHIRHGPISRRIHV